MGCDRKPGHPYGGARAVRTPARGGGEASFKWPDQAHVSVGILKA